MKMKKILAKLKLRLINRRGEAFIDIAILCLIVMIIFAFALAVLPSFITKMNLDSYAADLARTAEISGQVGTETQSRLEKLNSLKGLNPDITWSKNGKFQLGTDITVTVSKKVDMGFYVFGKNEITIKSTATATSEVFWKVL